MWISSFVVKLPVEMGAIEIEGLDVPNLACYERKYGSEPGKSCDERVVSE